MRASYLVTLFVGGCFNSWDRSWPDQSDGSSALSASSGAASGSCDRPEHEAQLCQACTTNDDCSGTGSLCLTEALAGEPGTPTLPSGRCGKECTVDCDCPEGYQCRGVGSSEQSLGRQCIPTSGQCPACMSDGDCPAQQVCEAQKCIAECTTDAQCASGLRCFEDGHCAEACCTNSDCPSGATCATGRCQ